MPFKKKDNRPQKLAEWLEKQVSDSSITDETIWNQMKLTKSTFYRLKPKAALIVSNRIKIRQKTIEETIVTETKEAVIKGLKSKQERTLILQNQIDEILKELSHNKATDYIMVGNKVKPVVKKLSPIQKAILRRTLRYLMSEISKIEGDYAPTKQLHAGDPENPTPIPVEVKGDVDMSKYTDEELLMFVNLAKKGITNAGDS